MLGQHNVAPRFQHFYDCLRGRNGGAVAGHGESKVDFHGGLYRSAAMGCISDDYTFELKISMETQNCFLLGIMPRSNKGSQPNRGANPVMDRNGSQAVMIPDALASAW